MGAAAGRGAQQSSVTSRSAACRWLRSPVTLHTARGFSRSLLQVTGGVPAERRRWTLGEKGYPVCLCVRLCGGVHGDGTRVRVVGRERRAGLGRHFAAGAAARAPAGLHARPRHLVQGAREGSQRLRSQGYLSSFRCILYQERSKRVWKDLF